MGLDKIEAVPRVWQYGLVETCSFRHEGAHVAHFWFFEEFQANIRLVFKDFLGRFDHISVSFLFP